MATENRSDRFTSRWEPRLGVKGARALHRSSMAALLLLTLPIWAVLASMAFYKHLVLFGILGVLIDVVFYSFWVSTRVQLAKEMSAYLGFPISWHGIPRMQYSDFDAWLERRRSGKERRKRWGFGIDE
jgi:hypothetical protein